MSKIKYYIDKLKNRSIVKEFSWHSLSAICVQIFSFVGVIFVSRYLGPTNLGIFAFVQNYIAIFITVLGAMDFYFTWHIAKSNNHVRDTFLFVIQKTQISFILLCTGLLGAFIFLPKDVFVLTVLLFTPLLLNGLSAFLTYALSQRLARLVSITQISVAFLFLISKFSLIYFEASLKYFVLVQALDMILASIILFIYFYFFKKWKYIKVEEVDASIKNTFKLIFEIRYNLVLVGFWQLVMRADQLILAKMTNAYTLGIYSAAVKLAEAPNAIVSVLGLVAYPRVVNYVQDNTAYSEHQIKRFMYLYLGAGLIISIPIFILAKYIIHILYGLKFEESISILQVYIFTIPSLFLCYYYMVVFGALEERKWPAIIAIISAVINIISVIIFTNYFNIIGTAFASTFSYFISALLFHYSYKYYKNNILETKNNLQNNKLKNI